MSASLSKRQLSSLLEVIEEGHTLVSLDEFREFIVRCISRLVECDSISYNEVDPLEGHVVSFMKPDHLRFDGDVELLGGLLAQHPVMSRTHQTGDGRAFKISDFVTMDEYHALDLYREVYAPLHTEYQMSFALPSPPPLIIGIALNRERRDFSEQERELLNLARPHLALIHRRVTQQGELLEHVSVLQQAVERLSQGVLVLDDADKVHLASVSAERLLRRFTGQTVTLGEQLPGQLGAWLAGQRRAFSGDFDAPPPAEPWITQRGSRRLVARYLPPLRPEDWAVILLDEDSLVLSRPALQRLNLTPREADVLVQLASGASNSAIARQIGVSEGTVGKHLEHIYAKLGVSTRTAAVARALERATRPATDES